MLLFSLLRCLTAGIKILPRRQKKNIVIQGGLAEFYCVQNAVYLHERFSKQTRHFHCGLKPCPLSLLWCGAVAPRPLTPPCPLAGWVVFPCWRGWYYLECRHPDDVGLGVVDGAGGFVAFGRGTGRCGHADDGGSDVWLVTVQRNRLLKFGVQTGSTGPTTDREETQECYIKRL